MAADSLAKLNRLASTAATACIFGVGILLAGVFLLDLSYNTTPSLPKGLYRIGELRGDPERGEIVGFCLEGEIARLSITRRYVRPPGLEPILHGFRCKEPVGIIGKHVVGLPGDTVDVGADMIRINGFPLRRSRAVLRDSRGRPVPHARWGRTILSPGEFWLHSPFTERANDSRVFGPVRRGQIVDRRVPILVSDSDE